jgi:hypothetical protein
MNCLVYSCFELAGAGLAAGAFYVVRDEEFKGETLKKDADSYGATA